MKIENINIIVGKETIHMYNLRNILKYLGYDTEFIFTTNHNNYVYRNNPKILFIDDEINNKYLLKLIINEFFDDIDIKEKYWKDINYTKIITTYNRYIFYRSNSNLDFHTDSIGLSVSDIDKILIN